MPSQTTHAATSRERIREAAKVLFAERGFEATSLASIARRAVTSESQVVKHFENKQGVLEAIFQDAWERINPAVRLATQSVSSPIDQFKILVEMVLNFLAGDETLRALMLLEGRRLRDDGKQLVLVPGFLEFVGIVDHILQELADQNLLAPEIEPQALRSGLMGAIEGLMRDKMLGRSRRSYPANYSDASIRSLCFTFLSSAMRSK